VYFLIPVVFHFIFLVLLWFKFGADNIMLELLSVFSVFAYYINNEEQYHQKYDNDNRVIGHCVVKVLKTVSISLNRTNIGIIGLLNL